MFKKISLFILLSLISSTGWCAATESKEDASHKAAVQVAVKDLDFLNGLKGKSCALKLCFSGEHSQLGVGVFVDDILDTLKGEKGAILFKMPEAPVENSIAIFQITSTLGILKSASLWLDSPVTALTVLFEEGGNMLAQSNRLDEEEYPEVKAYQVSATPMS